MVSVLDTVACYLNSEGKLRYTTYPPSMNIQYCSLQDVPRGVEVYLVVNRITSLPIGASFIDDRFEVETSNKPYSDSLNVNYSLGDRDLESLPGLQSIPHGMQMAGVKKLPVPKILIDNSGNPIEKIFKIAYTSFKIGTAVTEIYAIDGKRILTSENQATIGKNLLVIDASHLAAGVYSIEVKMSGKTLLRTKRTVVK